MTKNGRLFILDILRGFFLFVIIVDHVEFFPSFFDLFSGRGRLWVSAAEGFFFISGLLVGYIYRKKVASGFLVIWKKLWQRAGLLYVIAVLLSLLFTFLAVNFGNNNIKEGLPVVVDWPHIFVSTLNLTYSFGWADFLPHYVIFMLWAPLAFYLLIKKQWWLVLMLSAGLWMIRGNNFTLAWQVLFMGGMVVGFYWDALRQYVKSSPTTIKRPIFIVVVATAIISFTFSYSSVYVLSELNAVYNQLPDSLKSLTEQWNAINSSIWPWFEKWTLEPGRIILFLVWFTVLYVLVDRFYSKVPRFIMYYLQLLGRNSLFVYGLHSVIIFILHATISAPNNLFGNIIITCIVLGSIGVITWVKASGKHVFKLYQVFTWRNKRMYEK